MSSVAQHGPRVIEILQKVMAKNNVEPSRLRNVRPPGGVAVFDGDLVTDSGFDDRVFRQRQHRPRPIEQSYLNAKTRQSNGGNSCSAPKVEGAQWLDSRCLGQKILHVRKGQVSAQPALGSLEICGVPNRIVFETVFARDRCLHATLRRSRSPIQSLARTMAYTTRTKVVRRV